MRKTITKSLCILLVIALCLGAASLLTGCNRGDNTTVNVAMESDTAPLSLYLTAVAQGYFSGLDACLFVPDTGKSHADAMQEIVAKLEKTPLNRACTIGYFTVADYKEYAKDKEDLRIVLVDNYNASGEITGVWVSRKEWIESERAVYGKTIRALLRAMQYRAEHNDTTYAQATERVIATNADNLIEAIGTKVDDKVIIDSMYYVAIYAHDNTTGNKKNASNWVKVNASEGNVVSGESVQAKYQWMGVKEEDFNARYIELLQKEKDFAKQHAKDVDADTIKALTVEQIDTVLSAEKRAAFLAAKAQGDTELQKLYTEIWGGTLTDEALAAHFDFSPLAKTIVVEQEKSNDGAIKMDAKAIIILVVGGLAAIGAIWGITYTVIFFIKETKTYLAKKKVGTLNDEDTQEGASDNGEQEAEQASDNADAEVAESSDVEE